MLEQLLIDVGVGDEFFPPSDQLTAPNLLNFAEIEPAHIRAIPLEQHIAEKLHAYTRRCANDQPSSRAKDLVDIILMSELARFEFGRLREVIVQLFDARATHELPASVPAPPREWARAYRALAEEVRLDPDPAVGHRLVGTFLNPFAAAEPRLARWDADALRWRS